MKKIDLYIIRELLSPFLLSVVGLMIFISLSLAIQLSDLLLTKGARLFVLFRLLGLKIPGFLVFALPIAVLFAVFTVLARLVHDQEILALQVGGYSLRRIVVPLVIFGLLVAGAGLAVNNYLAPWADLRYRRSVYRIARGPEALQIESNLFFKGPQGRTYYVHKFRPQQNLLERVMIFDPTGIGLLGETERGSYPELLTSKRAKVRDGNWELTDGYMIHLSPQGQVEFTAGFGSLEVSVDRDAREFIEESRNPSEMGIGELLERIRMADRTGVDITDLRLALHSKIALPLAALVFALFSGPLSLLFRHRSRAVGILLSITMAGGFQGILLWGRTMVKRADFSPVFGAWMPDMIFGGLGLLLFIFLDRINPKRWTRPIRGPGCL